MTETLANLDPWLVTAQPDQDGKPTVNAENTIYTMISSKFPVVNQKTAVNGRRAHIPEVALP